MAVRTKVLCENAVYGTLGAVAEHGWSVWLETPSGAFLFDTGQGRSILNNARVFGLPLDEARAILISHHHIDHTGGLLETVHAMRWKSDRATVPVHAHPDLFKESFYESEGKREFIGVPHTRSALETAGARFHLAAGWQELAPGICLSGEVPRRTDFELGDQELRHYDELGNLVIDPVRDDQTVAIDTADGLFVVLGCSHAGLINILTHITEQTGSTRFHTVMGGTHLGPVSEAQVEQTIAALHDFDIGRIGVSHCTGQKVAARMAREFGERFFFCSVGTVVEAQREEPAAAKGHRPQNRLGRRRLNVSMTSCMSSSPCRSGRCRRNRRSSDERQAVSDEAGEFSHDARDDHRRDLVRLVLAGHQADEIGADNVEMGQHASHSNALRG